MQEEEEDRRVKERPKRVSDDDDPLENASLAYNFPLVFFLCDYRAVNGASCRTVICHPLSPPGNCAENPRTIADAP